MISPATEPQPGATAGDVRGAEPPASQPLTVPPSPGAVTLRDAREFAAMIETNRSTHALTLALAREIVQRRNGEMPAEMVQQLDALVDEAVAHAMGLQKLSIDLGAARLKAA